MSIDNLTPAQLRRERKKALRHGVSIVTCDDCGWTGANHGNRDEWGVWPCPRCGCETATDAHVQAGAEAPAKPQREMSSSDAQS